MQRIHICIIRHIIIFPITLIFILSLFYSNSHLDKLSVTIFLNGNKKAAAVGSGFLHFISFQNYAIGCAAEGVHIMHIIILQIVLIISC